MVGADPRKSVHRVGDLLNGLSRAGLSSADMFRALDVIVAARHATDPFDVPRGTPQRLHA